MRSYLLTLLLLTACGDDVDDDPVVDAALVDVPTDTGPANMCGMCSMSELCIQRYDGTCNVTTHCVKPTATCPGNVCSADCQLEYCPSPYQCMTRPLCGGEDPAAFTCYGP